MGCNDDGLVLEVKLLAAPCRWYWEIGAGTHTRLVASSWADEWVAFASRTEAAADGARRLLELRAAGSAARINASAHPSAEPLLVEPARRAG